MSNMLTHAKKSNAARAHFQALRGRSLGLEAGTTIQLARQLIRGLPYSAIVRFQRESGLPLGRIAEAVEIPPRTLVRRKATGRLRQDESERLLRISIVFDRAVDLFEGDTGAARKWLSLPRAELEDHSPLEFARTEIGAKDVEDLIGRLEYGVFS